MASEGASSLHEKYAISSTWQVTLGTGDNVEGTVYCTDAIANILVLKNQSNNDIRMISVDSIKTAKMLKGPTEDEPGPPVNPVHAKKMLDEREKRAIKLAQESLRNVNPKVRVYDDG